MRIDVTYERSKAALANPSAWLRGWLLLSVAMCLGSAFAAAPEETIPPAPIPLENMRVLAYSKEMAQRFGLPAPREGWETQPPLHAVEYRAEPPLPWAKVHGCAYKLYLDSQLPLAFGDSGPAGDFRLYVSAQHFFAQDWDNPSSRDAKIALSEKVGGFGRLALVATLDYAPDTRGASTDVGVSQAEYVRELLPGLTYLKLRGSCGMMSWEKRVDTVQLWLKKANSKDYRKRLVPDPDDFIKLPLPSALYRKALSWRGMFDKERKEYVKQLDGELRERQQGHSGNTQ
ncbi:MAG: hypothetical protein H3C26_01505 [Rhodocyclaceae bacterium]|nr:hypothetical protein [Rhodocyclaceae bacterium]